MRLLLFVVIAVVVGVRAADAEKVKTNQTTKVYAGPGEQKKVLLKVKSGQNMTLLEQEGRWLKVRVQGRTGYVPRSKVDMADDGEIVRNTRRRPFVDGRSRKRGFGGDAGPDDRVGADAVDTNDEDDSGEEEAEEEDEPKKPEKKASKPAKAEDEDEDEPKEASAGDDEEEASDDEEVVDDEELDEEEDKRPTARVAKKVSVFEDADSESEEKFVARPNDVLYPVETKGKWTAVENEEGDFGWIETQYLDTDDGGGAPGKRTIAVGARVGLMFIQQGMRTQGSQNLKVPDNYNIGTSSVTLSLGGAFTMPFKKSFILGAEATYDFSNTAFGGVTYDPDGAANPMPAVVTKLSIHNINVRGMFGKDFKRKSGMAVFGRLGYRYQSYLVAGYSDPVKNPAKIPQEIVKAPTIGAAFAMPRLTEKIGIGVTVDAILFGASIAQTAGLEDGTAPTLKAVTLGTGVVYKWGKKKFDLALNYDLRYMAVDFGPPPMTMMGRGHMGTNVTRVDFFHTLTFGVLRPF